MILHKISPSKIGLVQTMIVIAYIACFAFTVQSVHAWLGDIFTNQIVGMAFFLTVFVFSALFCASAMLGYPALLCFEKNYRRAMSVLFWSIGWLAIFLATAAVIAVGMSIR
jgi:hypothetical protein